jgi:DNA-binding protein HU-beta
MAEAKATILNKEAIVTSIATDTGMTKAAAGDAFDSVLAAIKKGLVEGNDVRLHGIGSLRTKQAAARTGCNPRTGEKIQIAARREVKFSVSEDLKKAVAAA